MTFILKITKLVHTISTAYYAGFWEQNHLILLQNMQHCSGFQSESRRTPYEVAAHRWGWDCLPKSKMYIFKCENINKIRVSAYHPTKQTRSGSTKVTIPRAFRSMLYDFGSSQFYINLSNRKSWILFSTFLCCHKTQTTEPTVDELRKVETVVSA